MVGWNFGLPYPCFTASRDLVPSRTLPFFIDRARRVPYVDALSGKGRDQAKKLSQRAGFRSFSYVPTLKENAG